VISFPTGDISALAVRMSTMGGQSAVANTVSDLDYVGGEPPAGEDNFIGAPGDPTAAALAEVPAASVHDCGCLVRQAMRAAEASSGEDAGLLATCQDDPRAFQYLLLSIGFSPTCDQKWFQRPVVWIGAGVAAVAAIALGTVVRR